MEMAVEQRDWELLHQQMRASGPQRRDSLVGPLMIAMFIVGLTMGSVLLPQQDQTKKLASIGPQMAFMPSSLPSRVSDFN
jgi:hypothetical protein